ncbi:putative ATP:cob(I)alamin adenosyltransferase [Dictyocaulus viviparus]|uniref:Putative ATP:cob(I)alamin adenosyltransferase n=1 Tax=Dictyocaulus viviparus TaxID=29172 RepID=A0A0D8Y2A5_DICVI|nr:putative ATP:cob(I)alamin adenosyltransferase [Dictyocaulus viviparus]
MVSCGYICLLRRLSVFPATRQLSLSVIQLGRGFKQGRGTGDAGKSSLYNNERRWKDDNTFMALAKTFIDINMVEWINAEIDRFGDQVPSLRQFILSGGGMTSAHIQYARAVCRRAERSVVPLVRDEEADPQAMKFLNRLSDLLFVLGRYACMRTKHDELTYLRPETFVSQKWERKKL